MITAENIAPKPFIHKEPKPIVTKAFLRARTTYKDGNLYWKYWKKNSKHWNERYVGTVVGTYNNARKNTGTIIDGKQYVLHRLIWIYHNGYIDSHDRVVHKNNRLDNSIENLYLIPNSKA